MHNSHLVLTYFTSSFPLTTENTSNNDHAPTKNNSNNILRFSNTNHHIHPNSTHNFGAPSSSTSSSSTTAHTPFGPTGRGFGAGLSTLSSPSGRSTKTVRKISRLPYKVLDAPGICDDYYLNLGQPQSIILSCIHCVYNLFLSIISDDYYLNLGQAPPIIIHNPIPLYIYTPPGLFFYYNIT